MCEPFKDLIGPAWEEVCPAASGGPGGRPGTYWNWRLTPPLPSSWPPGPGGTLVFYAYAEGNEMGLDDGVRVAAPWARVEVAPGGGRTPVLHLLSGQLSELGIQGVWPVSAAEVAELNRGPSVPELLERAAASASAAEAARPALARYFADWNHCNGVIARAVRADHESFFGWLEGPGQ